MIDFEEATAEDLLKWALTSWGSRFAVVTSFQLEGMVLLDMAIRLSPTVRVLSVDTGRMPPETYEMIETVRNRYGIPVEVILPDAAEVSAMVTRHGPNLFYRELGMRNLCCQIRKVRPLENRLRDFSAWAVGLRREQAESRREVPKAEQVEGRWKLSPLADWTKDAIWRYARQNDVPIHPLYQQGYASIGCAPCTRAIEPGADERSGRWWWEEGAVKECGIHFSAGGPPRRKLDVLLEEVLSR